jgi:hypothetical protein
MKRINKATFQVLKTMMSLKEIVRGFQYRYSILNLQNQIENLLYRIVREFQSLDHKSKENILILLILMKRYRLKKFKKKLMN